ncbi:NADP-specific glutamate dehydrogenase [Thalassospira sp. HF15]|uniref:NADP-specific glutamate dehydrogenase n=1 Tax=Thalassospira sp. HF15 TaxID=2722755 RepID=UPI00142F755C|nr:NADP-specific glutamate dehydrogenase [Thalassospira sp. HF15]NIY77186.1 NADP-specific glutamate dehydrogenase [Thalassospira sp. HF15]
MTKRASDFSKDFVTRLEEKTPNEPEFHQAVEEVVGSVAGWYVDQTEMRKNAVLERCTEPDRVLQFRVAWEDDEQQIHVNRGWRVQFNQSMGPYKGGLRFAPTVSTSIFKFLGFEQTLKNSLTGLPMGGAKGGADFSPKGKSPQEIGRFCQAFMQELYQHIGADTDVPAGDIGVGKREISILFGHYIKLTQQWAGALTGKGCDFGGSAGRTEATGFGCIYFLGHMLDQQSEELKGKRIAISGAGNVALHAARKAIELDAKVISLSDSTGTIHFADGMTNDLLDQIDDWKTNQRKSLSDFDGGKGCEFLEDQKPWGLECDIALPCATQNELDEDDAKQLVDNKVMMVCDGANMPLTAKAQTAFLNADIPHAPGKASNAGGVAVSGLEQSQNAQRLSWDTESVDKRLREIMSNIHQDCIENSPDGKIINYRDGANLASFKRVAETMNAFWLS